jgi:hypothetical protein
LNHAACRERAPQSGGEVILGDGAADGDRPGDGLHSRIARG